MRRQLVLALLLGGSVFAAGARAEQAEASVNYDHIVPAAKQYIGVPYRWGGTTAKGFDCSGFIRHVYQSIGIDTPRTATDMYRMGKRVDKSALRVGDLVFFNTSGKGVSHAGIYIGNNRFIHSSSSKGVTISSLNDSYWKKTYIGAKRVLAYRLAPGQFQDVPPSHWAFDEVRTLSEQELVIGYEDSYFKPDEPITRAEVAAYLAEYLDLNLSDRSVPFNDVPDDYWALGAIRAVQKQGIMNGSNGKFHPEDTLTRAQLAAVLTRAFRLQPPAAAKSFTDVPPSFWAFRDIQALAAAGITTGRTDGSFGPNDPVTRVQFAAFLYRAMHQ
ncbi:C40 family peptidase [Parageobacillus thermoglucosidasius]|uniref:S-layer homology domain-containing protein n=1 Tax=Parageobacillus thermoglucosidasius TaxID=1426 RepID=A0AB38R084_PARTM|nr:C40 family peptidase [Parageobacillus thermoglucosidasius]UOE76122.1 S-layer homology domain-containing protein [Parageobacillus thermoglucosidasius]